MGSELHSVYGPVPSIQVWRTKAPRKKTLARDSQPVAMVDDLEEQRAPLDRRNPEFWANVGSAEQTTQHGWNAHYEGLTPAGFVEFLRITNEQRWPRTYHVLRKIGLGIDVVDWLEFVVGEDADEQVVVAEFVGWMRLNGGCLVSFAQTPNSVKAAHEETSSPGARQVVNRRLGQALSAITPRRWPEVVLGSAHAIVGRSGSASQVLSRCRSTE